VTGSTLLVTLTVDELRELVREQTRAELGRLATTSAREVLTLKELEEFLDRSERSIKKLIEQGLPAYYISDREPRFIRSKVLAWLETLPTKPAADRDERAA
jgi:hypothetical protein